MRLPETNGIATPIIVMTISTGEYTNTILGIEHSIEVKNRALFVYIIYFFSSSPRRYTIYKKKSPLRVLLEAVRIALNETRREESAFAPLCNATSFFELLTFLVTIALQHCKLI